MGRGRRCLSAIAPETDDNVFFVDVNVCPT